LWLVPTGSTTEEERKELISKTRLHNDQSLRIFTTKAKKSQKRMRGGAVVCVDRQAGLGLTLANKGEKKSSIHHQESKPANRKEEGPTSEKPYSLRQWLERFPRCCTSTCTSCFTACPF
jgi:hypothetical protein